MDRLGNEKYKSKVELRTVNPKWLEQFDFHLFEDQSQLLEISVWDKDPRSKDDFIGRFALPFRQLSRRRRNTCKLNPKFKRQIFVRNVNRVKAAIMDIYDFGLYVKSCFEWESPFRSIVAFVLFVIITYYFEAYMLPAFLLLLFVKNYIVISIVGSRYPKDEDAESSANEDEIDEDDKDKHVQFHGSFPVLVDVLLWGINKFSRKLIRPHSVVNNELTDFLSRVPDDEELKDFREIRPTNLQTHDDRKREGKKKKI
ncbi:Multiple C2 and transmembrane domain-containing protein 2 [Armadillidium vulgare]|nr:Multiple C2 and transmembrane domain-containing protein 2 [Armadillidium vulgare]